MTNSGTALYLQESGDARQIELTDIQQGEQPDCFLLATLADIAFRDPAFIYRDMIHQNTDGTESVTLYDNSDGSVITSGSTYWTYDHGHLDVVPKSFVPTSVGVDNNFISNGVNSFNNSDVVNGLKETWPQVVEEAYDHYSGGFSAAGGDSVVATEALTGRQAFWQDSQHVSLNELEHLNNANSIITFSVGQQQEPYNLIANHVYAFEGFTRRDGHTFLNLYNPWGTTQPDPIPFAQVAKVFVGVTHGSI